MDREVNILRVERCAVAILLLSACLVASTQGFACAGNSGCNNCSADKEMTWNPDDQYVTKRLERFYSLGDALPIAYKSGDTRKVKALATEYLNLAAIYHCNWNYGNAIHDANRYLGLVSLKAGDADQAAGYLVAAGKSTGSPQLDTFGPELDLANALLDAGKIDAVKTYLKEVKSFWTMDEGAIDDWTAAIDRGERPKMNRALPPSLQSPIPHGVWVLIALVPYLWTALLVLVFFLIRFKHIARKPLFLLVGGAAAFCTMFLGSLGSGYPGQYVISSSDSVATMAVLWGLMTLLVGLLPLLALFITSRFFRLTPAP